MPYSNYTIDRLASEKSASNETTKVEDVIERGAFSFRLEDLAFARSGDKGNHCNIGRLLVFIHCFCSSEIVKYIVNFKL